MGALGTYLRELRESRQSSLDEMARSTRVGKRQLEALEAEEFSELPAPVFVKGFIRAYCGFLEVGPDEALARYRSIIGDTDPQTRTAPLAAPKASWSGSPLVVTIGLLVVLGLALVAVNFLLRASTPTPASTTPIAPSSTVHPAPSSAPTAAVKAPDDPPARPVERPATAPAPPAQRLVVKAVETTWIRVKTDDGTVVQELLQPGAVREWTSEQRFLLTVGNAGGIEVELNGRPLPPLGARGKVINQLVLPAEKEPGS